MTYLTTRKETRYNSESLERFFEGFIYEITGYGLKTQSRTIASKQIVLDTYCLLYIVSGTISIVSRDISARFGANELLMFEPFRFYQIDLSADSSISFYQIAFEVKPAYHHTAFRTMIFNSKNSMSLPQILTNFEPQMSVLFRSHNRNDEMQIHDLLSDIIKQVFKVNSASKELPLLRMTAERKLAKRAIEYIDANIRLPLKVSDVSSYLEVSESYLYKAFLHLVGVPPGRYILHQKAKAAAKLLCVERHVIGDVAIMMGYSSLFHFSKSFKNIYGLSPRAYTKAILRREYLI